MTNHILPRDDDPIAAAIRTLAPVGGKRRPVKIVDHPAFRDRTPAATRRMRDRHAPGVPILVLPLRVVSLNHPSPTPGRRCPCATPIPEAA